MPPAPGYAITDSPNQPIRSANDTVEFRRNYGSNEFVNALYALDNGWTGKGVTIGVLDTGANTTLDEFTGRISPLSKSFGTVTRGGVTTARTDLGDAISSTHGTSVAAIIGANRNGAGAMGFAPEASLAILNTNDYNYDTNIGYIGYQLEAIDYATANNIKVVSRSIISGCRGTIVASGMVDAVTRYAGIKGLLVNGAGNDSLANPDDAANVTPANMASWLFVVAINENLMTPIQIAGYSNHAGTMMYRTVAAPGSNVVTDSNGNLHNFDGTSSATPVVSALAATILQKWPQLTGQDAGNVILSTAKDIGAAGPDPVFGMGLVDFKAALSPVNPTISNGLHTTSIDLSAMAVAPAIGTAPLKAKLASVTVLDRFGRDFSGSLSGLVLQPEASPSHWLRQRLLQMQSGGNSVVSVGGFTTNVGYANVRTGPNDNDRHSIMTAGSVGYRNDDIGVTLGFNAQDNLQSDLMGLAPFADGILAYAPQAGNSLTVDRTTTIGRLGITLSNGHEGLSQASAATVSLTTGRTTLRASFIDENGSVLGAIGTGGLALGRGSTTTMIEAKQTVALTGGWDLEGYGSVGMTHLKVDDRSVVTGSTPLLGTRLGIQATGPAWGGTLSFGIAQPLTIESGKALLTLGSGYDLSTRSLTYSGSSASLASSQRKLELTAGFAHSWTNSSLRLGAMRDVTNGDVKALMGWAERF